MGLLHNVKDLLGSKKDKNQNKDFGYLDELIHSGAEKIVLDFDIVLDSSEKSKYLEGIKLDVDDLVIDGNDHAIDAKRKTRIFDCTGKNVIIKNIILENGVSGKGSAINNCGDLTIVDSIIKQNKSSNLVKGGGAIYNTGAVTINGSSLNNNDGGGIYNREGVVEINQSSLNNNNGGGIYNSDGVAEIKESSLNNNGRSAIISGAIVNSGDLTISKSTIRKNRAHKGGAIDNMGVLKIFESLMDNNKAKHGGAISNSRNGNCKIYYCQLSNNSSPNNIFINKGHLEISNSNFMNNMARNIIENEPYMMEDIVVLSITDGKFIDNRAHKSVIFNNKTCIVSRCIFENNFSNNAGSNNIVNRNDLTLISPNIKDEGKTIFNEGDIFIKTPFDLDIIYGLGKIEMNAIPKGKKFDFGYLDKIIHESRTNEIVLDEDICFENYEHDFYEGGIELDIDDLVIDGNGHTIDGGDKSRIFVILGNNITLKNIIFKNGRSYFHPDVLPNCNGGAIKTNHSADLIIENCKFLNNYSENNAGAIHNCGQLSLKKSVVTGNESRHGGGSMLNEGTLKIIESTLSDNTAPVGGAIYNYGDLAMSKSTLTKNIAIGSSSPHGGAIYNEGVVTLSESLFSKNEGEAQGGAIDNNGDLIISKSRFIQNTSHFGGGAIHHDLGTLNIAESTFNENKSYIWHGGAIRNYGGKLTIMNCDMENNEPDDINDLSGKKEKPNKTPVLL